MNKIGKTTIWLAPFLVLVLLTASIYIFMPEKVKIVVEETNTKFSVWEDDKWVLSATEYVYIYDGTTKMRASSREVTTYTDGDITYIIRSATWKDNISTVDTYKFDSTADDVTLFPIEHKVEILNAENKILHFEYRDILYDGETKVISSPFNFGHKMTLEWEDNAYYSKVFQQTYASDKIIVRYRVTSDDFIANVRLFDPPTSIFNASIIPSSPVENDDLLGYCNGTDTQLSYISYENKWYKDSVLFSEASYNNISNWSETDFMTHDIGDIGGYTGPVVFNISGDLKMLVGLTSTWTAFDWNGTNFVYNASLFSGLGTPESVPKPTAYYKDDRWNIIVGDYLGLFQSFYWNETNWVSDSALTAGLVSTGGWSNPSVIYHDNTYKLITGANSGALDGYHWSESSWVSNSSLINGLPTTFAVSAPELYIEDDILKIGIGTESSGIYFYTWNDSIWSATEYPNNGVRDVGNHINAETFTYNEVLHFYASQSSGFIFDFTKRQTFPVDVASNISVVPSDNVTGGANFTFSCRSFTGLDYSSWINSSDVNIDYLPVFGNDSSYMLNSDGGTTLFTDRNITGYCNMSDVNTDIINYNYTFYINNVANETGQLLSVSQGVAYNVGNLTNDNFVLDDDIVLECTAWYNPSVSGNSSSYTISNIDYPISLLLDGLAEDRKYEWQTYVNVTTVPPTNRTSYCLDILYPAYGVDFVCYTNVTSGEYLFLLEDPSITTFSSGDSDYDYDFPYYSWLSNTVEIDSQYNLSSVTFGLSGSISDIIITQFDDWDTLDVEKSYFVANDTSTVINMSIDGDVELIGANFIVSAPSGFNITNLSIDMFSDGVIDYTYDGFIDEFVNDLAVINVTLVNDFITGSNFKVINFSLDADLNGTVLIKSVFFVKSAATYPLDVEIDIGYDGASDAEYKGSMIGSTLFVDTNTDGLSSKVFTCEDTLCSYNMSFELNKVQTYDNCYMYVEGSGLNSSFVEEFTSSTYEESNSLNTIEYFGQIQMSGSSGSFSNGEYVSTLISNLSEDIEYLTLTVNDQIDSGATITYYVSLDNGTNWYETTNGIPYHFSTAGHQPKFKFVMTTNVARTVNAYITDVTLTDIGSYSDLFQIIINDSVYNYSYTFDSSLGLFKTNFGCTEVNELLDACTTLTCDIDLIINITNPGIISSTQYYFGGTLDSVDLGSEIFIKHQVNEQTSLTSVTNTTSEVNDTIFNLTMDYPEYSVSNDVFINITGSYWR